jgi:type III secretory pathway lipoprotein EscJ
MREVLRSNDPVELSFIVVLLRDAGIEALVLDEHTSVLEGSIGAIPRRVTVAEEDFSAARDLLRDAGLCSP